MPQKRHSACSVPGRNPKCSEITLLQPSALTKEMEHQRSGVTLHARFAPPPLQTFVSEDTTQGACKGHINIMIINLQQQLKSPTCRSL